MPTEARRAAEWEIAVTAQKLATQARYSHRTARREAVGRCVLCAAEPVFPAFLATPAKTPCPERHFVGAVATWFELTSSLPRRRKNAIVRRLWALFPEARADLVSPAA